MGIAKNQHTEKIVVLKNTISKALSSVRKDRAMVQNLFELLENDDKFYNKEPQFIKIALGGRNHNGNDVPDTLYQSFCEAYTIRLLEEYVRSQKYLYLLFATFGFLPGYKDLFLKERYAKYAEENPNVKFKEGTKAIAKLKYPSSSLQKIENEKIDEVAARLEKDISKKGGRLGFVSAILDELTERFPAGLPEELPADFLKPIRTDSPSDKVLSQNVVLEDDKIEHTGQVPNTPIEISDEGTVANELASEDSTPKKLIAMQSRLQTWRSILKTRKGIITVLAAVLIIFVIVFNILVRHITDTRDSDPPPGELPILISEVVKYNFTLDAGKGTVINIYGMPGDADIEDLEILIRPEDTDLITVEPVPADIPQVLPLLIKTQEIRSGEVENWEDESKTNIITIVAIYKTHTLVCMNVTVEPNSEEEFSKELSGNGGED